MEGISYVAETNSLHVGDFTSDVSQACGTENEAMVDTECDE